MSWEKEGELVKRTESPITQNFLVGEFHKIDLKAGDTIIVHSSMSKIGWVIGTSITVINALMEVLTPDGTLVMPTFSSDNTDPQNWSRPPVPDSWKPIIREHMPAFQPRITPTRGMGRIPETFRNYPDTLRSSHPQCSFTAWGKHKEKICSNHPLTPVFGEISPLEQLYDLQGKILLLGVDHGNNTSLHYAECRAEIVNQPRKKTGAAIMKDGKRIWEVWEDYEYDDEDFTELGKEFEEKFGFQTMKVGQADTKLLPVKELVDFAIPWFEKNRK